MRKLLSTYIPNRAVAFALAAVFAVMLIANCCTPLMFDDWFYSFYYDSDVFQESSDKPLESISDIILSQWQHFLIINGRNPVHATAQLFLLIGKPIFNVCNALMFPLFTLLLMRCADRKISWLGVLFATLLLMLFIPSPIFRFVWLTGSINYLWSAVFNLLFLIVFSKNAEENTTFWRGCGWLLFGLFSGWSHECFCVGIAGTLAIYSAWTIIKKRHLGAKKILLISGYWIGTLILALAPGSRARAHAIFEGISASQILMIFSAKIMLIAAMLCLLLWIKNFQSFRKFIRGNILYIIAIIIEFIFLLTIPQHLNERAFFGLDIFGLVLIFSYLNMCDFKPARWHVICTVLMFGFFAFGSIFTSVKNRNFTNRFYDAITASPDGNVVFPFDMHDGDFFDNHFYGDMEFVGPIVPIVGKSACKMLAIKFNKPKVSVISPADSAALADPNFFCEKNRVGDVYTTPSMHFYAIPDSAREVQTITVTTAPIPTDEMTLSQRITSLYSHRYNQGYTFTYPVLSKPSPNGSCTLITKPNFDRKIASVNI